MERAKKVHTISFRLDDEQWQLVETAAAAAGKNPNDWCRDLALAELDRGHGFSSNERLFFEELARVRYLLGNGFGMLASEELTPEAWQKIRDDATEKAPQMVDVLVRKYGR